MVQIHPPQPSFSIGCTDFERTEKLPLTPNSSNRVASANGFLRFAVEDHLNDLAVGPTFAVCHVQKELMRHPSIQTKLNIYAKAIELGMIEALRVYGPGSKSCI